LSGGVAPPAGGGAALSTKPKIAQIDLQPLIDFLRRAATSKQQEEIDKWLKDHDMEAVITTRDGVFISLFKFVLY
jgi:hypothetical protein